MEKSFINKAHFREGILFLVWIECNPNTPSLSSLLLCQIGFLFAESKCECVPHKNKAQTSPPLPSSTAEAAVSTQRPSASHANLS